VLRVWTYDFEVRTEGIRASFASDVSRIVRLDGCVRRAASAAARPTDPEPITQMLEPGRGRRILRIVEAPVWMPQVKAAERTSSDGERFMGTRERWSASAIRVIEDWPKKKEERGFPDRVVTAVCGDDDVEEEGRWPPKFSVRMDGQ